MKALILLNGEAPSRELLVEYWDRVDLRVCADGAANLLFEYQLMPDSILGDLDSISSDSLSFFDEALLSKNPDQNTTDGEKSINFCLEKGCEEILLFGALGKREDHGLYNLGLLKQYHAHNIKILTNEDEIYLITGREEIRNRAGARISLMPLFGTVKNVFTQGLAYPIESKSLEFGFFSSISNQIDQDTASIDFKEGELLVLLERG